MTIRRVAVAGAGIVGLSTAWFLQDRGIEVTVLDRVGVAGDASWGNAGWLAPALTLPLPEPGVLRYGLRSMFRPSSPVYVPPTTDVPTAYVAVKVPESDLGGLNRFNAELILDSSDQAGLVVPSSALFTTGQGSTVKLQDGEEIRDIPVQVTFSANGYSMIDVDPDSGLVAGSQVLISTGTL